MPTPTGKPKVGERWRWRSPAWRVQPDTEWYEGTVVRRTDGDTWAAKMRLDDGRTQWVLTAQYYIEQEAFEYVPPTGSTQGEPQGDLLHVDVYDDVVQVSDTNSAVIMQFPTEGKTLKEILDKKYTLRHFIATAEDHRSR